MQPQTESKAPSLDHSNLTNAKQIQEVDSNKIPTEYCSNAQAVCSHDKTSTPTIAMGTSKILEYTYLLILEEVAIVPMQ